jgi:hypothetical protein
METIEKEPCPSYDMFTKAGDKMCHALVNKVSKKVKGKHRVTKQELIDMIVDGMKKISYKHGEVYDTEPEYMICHRINEVCNGVGYNFDLSRYDF